MTISRILRELPRPLFQWLHKHTAWACGYDCDCYWTGYGAAKDKVEPSPASLRAEYERQEAPLWAEYLRQLAPIRAEYERQRASLLAKYRRQKASLWAEFERQKAQK